MVSEAFRAVFWALQAPGMFYDLSIQVNSSQVSERLALARVNGRWRTVHDRLDGGFNGECIIRCHGASDWTAVAIRLRDSAGQDCYFELIERYIATGEPHGYAARSCSHEDFKKHRAIVGELKDGFDAGGGR